MICRLNRLVTTGYPRGLGPLDLVFESGSICSVTGRAGSGKTVLARCVAGVANPASGSIELVDNSGCHRISEADGFLIPTLAPLLAHLHVREHLQLLLACRGLRASRAEIVRWLRVAELADNRHHLLASDLSVVERWSVWFAAHLATNAMILVADDPFRDLLPDDTSTVARLLREAAADKLVFVTAREAHSEIHPSFTLSRGTLLQEPNPLSAAAKLDDVVSSHP